ncbi:MAG: hypothetical protein ACI3Z9_05935 [Candidatus Onthomorpha sp.]
MTDKEIEAKIDEICKTLKIDKQMLLEYVGDDVKKLNELENSSKPIDEKDPAFQRLVKKIKRDIK